MHHNNIEGAKSKGAEKASKYLWEKLANIVAKNIQKNMECCSKITVGQQFPTQAKWLFWNSNKLPENS